MVTVGRIIRPHGHRGQVVVASETDFGDERFREGAVLYTMRGERVEPLTVTASRAFNGRWVVGFDRVATMNEAEALRGQELRIAASDVRVLEPGRFYLHDLVGCTVETVAGDVVGQVDAVHTDTGTPVLSVMRGGHERLVPFAETICRRVDVQARRIVIAPPDGLIDDDR